MTEILAVLAAALTAVIGFLWGKKRFNDGYTTGRVDQVEELADESERTRAIIREADRRAASRAAARKRINAQNFERVVGRPPTDAELDEFLRAAEKLRQ